MKLSFFPTVNSLRKGKKGG